MEFLIAGCFLVPLSALWIQTQEDDSDEDEWDVPDFNKDEASSAATTVLSVAAADAAKDAGTFSDEEDEVRWLCSAKLGGPAHSSFMPCLANSI